MLLGFGYNLSTPLPFFFARRRMNDASVSLRESGRPRNRSVLTKGYPGIRGFQAVGKYFDHRPGAGDGKILN